MSDLPRILAFVVIATMAATGCAKPAPQNMQQCQRCGTWWELEQADPTKPIKPITKCPRCPTYACDDGLLMMARLAVAKSSLKICPGKESLVELVSQLEKELDSHVRQCEGCQKEMESRNKIPQS